MLNRTSIFFNAAIILIDLLLINIVLFLLFRLCDMNSYDDNVWSIALKVSVCYFVCAARANIVLNENVFSLVTIIRNVTINIISLYVLIMFLVPMSKIMTAFLFFFSVISYILLIFLRMMERKIVINIASISHHKDNVIFVGDSLNLLELKKEMNRSISYNYNIRGYFADLINDNTFDDVTYLGTTNQIIDYLKENEIHSIYCALPSKDKDKILSIIDYCDKHFVHFYSVPNVRNYFSNAMTFKLYGDVPVLSLHNDPLARRDYRLIKRAFDVICSSLFLFTIFPFIYIIVGLAVKISSPGPVFFKQKRNGFRGKEFYCYKFRSMKVNVDSDKVQATKDDPRKTRVGEFLRKSNIDELPQFINVLKGDMSIVGPRPHMLKHTEEYSALINKYMVRHFIKPGITGWAQVTGCRGETKQLSEMENRVKADIWYIDHWTIWLDLFILYKTVKNIIVGDKQAY